MKVRYNELSDAEKKKYLGEFYSVIAQLKTRDEVKKFFKDLLFLSEVVMLSRRIQIAKMLMEGETHDNIRIKMKVGFGTIAGVERWLKEGFGGYKEMIGRYNKNKAKKKSRVQRRRISVLNKMASQEVSSSFFADEPRKKRLNSYYDI